LPESSNAGGYQNPEVDKLIEQLRVTMNPDKQIEIYHKIHRQIYDDQPYTFLFMDLVLAGYDSRIENVKFYPIRPCIDTREWYARTPRVKGP
jgi:peptide/nickel transport system substrate-binding protein